MNNPEYILVGDMYACDGVFIPQIIFRGSYRRCEAASIGIDPYMYKDVRIVLAESEDE
jgi:hypothetical protein